MPDAGTPEWAANSKTIHAWVPWIANRYGRTGRWGLKSLCGQRTPHDFGWSIPVTWPDALAVAKRFHFPTPVCSECVERADAHHPTDSESGH